MPVSMTPLLALPPAANHPAGLRQRAPSAHGSPPVAERFRKSIHGQKSQEHSAKPRWIKDDFRIFQEDIRKISGRYHENEMLIFLTSVAVTSNFHPFSAFGCRGANSNPATLLTLPVRRVRVGMCALLERSRKISKDFKK